ncbi:glycosyltransferase family 4 protein [Halobacterium sp. BOL4-2]|uniref:glycosyltransferase family 4 protein n=1 Tax=Halobacterium sp. BOL4-2 TaxID=2810537 RepID=UPI0019658DD5|nr:glycosyltransferase family 4 protein [Halobacterium sp. BOL4-2]QRY24868.1 glycosyltransferase family 4 protein [Halobacterium sp. BOL4-2]
MERLGILYYVTSFPKLSESFVLNEIRELKHRGHNVAVFALDNPSEEITHEEYRNISVPTYYADVSYIDAHSILSITSIKMAIKYGNSSLLSQLSTKSIVYSLVLGRLCSDFINSLDFDIDVIHGHFADSSKGGEILAARNHQVSCTVTAHAAEIFKNPNHQKTRFICDNVDHVIVPSDYNRQYLSEEAGVSNEMTVVPATSSTEKFGPSAPTVENRLLTVARLVEKKGYKFAIKAVKELVDRGYDIEYHIIGSGDLEGELQQQVEKYGIKDHVKFLGHVSDEVLRQELSEACVFLLPCVIAENGDRDAMPVALKEAMASETACVSTTVSAIPELITHGRDGLLVAPRETEELANAVNNLLDNPDRRRELAGNGRETVNNKFDIKDSVQTLVDVFYIIK